MQVPVPSRAVLLGALGLGAALAVGAAFLLVVGLAGILWLGPSVRHCPLASPDGSRVVWLNETCSIPGCDIEAGWSRWWGNSVRLLDTDCSDVEATWEADRVRLKGRAGQAGVLPFE